MSGEQLSTLKIERRAQLDGGLNTRAGIFMDPSEARALQNWRLRRDGELEKRRGGTRLQALAIPEVFNSSWKFVCTPSATGGSLPADTYAFSFTIGTIHGETQAISLETTGVVVGGAGAGSVLLQLPTLNSGDGVGRVSGAYDDPINGGYVNDANLRVYARRGADARTLQGALSFTWNSSTGAYEATFTTYTTNGASAPGTGRALPLRALIYHEELEQVIVVIGTMAGISDSTFSSFTQFDIAKDASGNLYRFSRLPTRIHSTILDGVLVVSDGVGKPKKLNTQTPGSPTTYSFINCGLVAPSGACTATASATAGVLNGGYQYIITFVETITRPDGTTYTFESGSSPGSNSVTPVNKKVDLTSIPVSSETRFGSASVVTARRIYRNVTGGSTFFLVDTISDNVTTTYTDNTADASLGTSTPPDGPNKIADSPPVAGTHFVTEHAGRIFGVKSKFKADASGRILRLQMTNEIVYTKAGLVDSWPSTFSVKCGPSAPITALRSFRGVLYVFKEKEIGVLEGSGLSSDLDFSYRTIWRGAGAMENSVVEVGNSLYVFDQALTAIRVSGYTVEPVATDALQLQWNTSVTLDSSGEASTGGGRGTANVLSVIWDPVNSEVRWTISDYVTDYTVVAATSYVMKAYEYVMMLRDPSKPRFTLFTGAVSGSTKDRRIMSGVRALTSSNAAYRVFDVLYGDYHGRIVKDDQVEYDLDPSPANISLSGEFPIFFGDNPEAVKAFRHLYLLMKLGATAGDALTFKMSSLVKQTGAGVPKTLVTVNGGSTEFRMQRADVPSQPDTVNTAIQGLLVTVTGAAQSGPLRLCEMSMRMTSGSDGRNAP